MSHGRRMYQAPDILREPGGGGGGIKQGALCTNTTGVLGTKRRALPTPPNSDVHSSRAVCPGIAVDISSPTLFFRDEPANLAEQATVSYMGDNRNTDRTSISR